MFDYHVHTVHSSDCETPMSASCEAAIKAGIREIAFTDHVEFEPSDDAYEYFRYEVFMRDLEEARSRFGDELTILAGAEVGFNVRIMPEIEAFLASHEFDFVIGSVHHSPDGIIIFPEYFEKHHYSRVMQTYFQQLTAAAGTGWFDTIGHLDLPKRYAPPAAGPYDPLSLESELRTLLQAIIDANMSFEINTSGIRQAPKTSMPSAQVVRLYVEMGGTLITIGTDSHVPATIGAGLERTLDMLQLCGIHEVGSFRLRRRTQVPIDSLRGIAPMAG
ncbi:MAG TPA: histidinol-phosphatase HisJ family protein [Thermomicrobiales bacterium]|nr:histidinol-phosphatase HisJ family protein [Thermomicrobiales bacterium]